METIIALVVTHDKPIEGLHQLIANRAWTIDGVKLVEVVDEDQPWPELHPPGVLDTILSVTADSEQDSWHTNNAPL